MRWGVLADVHANLAALDAVVAALDRHGIDGWLCAGDVVGYGPEPIACIARLDELGALCVAGNHDLIALGELPEPDFPLARQTLRWTRAHLGAPELAWLAALPPSVRKAGVTVAHGALGDPERYVRSRAEGREQLRALGPEATPGEVLLLGHTHVPLAVVDGDGGALRRGGRRQGVLALPREQRVLLNPGAVGQSREAALVARGMVLDLERRQATFVAVAYDAERTRAALRAHGLPAAAIHLPPTPAARRVLRLARRVAHRLVRPRQPE